MISAVWMTTPFPALPCYGRPLRVFFLMLLSVLLTGCGASFNSRHMVSDLPPLQLEDRTVETAEVAARVSSPDLLAVDPQMREFVQLYTGDIRHPRQRLLVLHRAISGSATLGIDYDPVAGGTASQVFHRGTANCLSYASLFIALAREAGLEAGYQWLDVRPQWTRQGERVMVRMHVNALVELGRMSQFMVDIDPLESRDIAGSRRLSDDDASALYHSNIAMQALAANDLEQAWLQAVRALQLSPTMAHLWINLGAIYRVAGQYRGAENSYQHALLLDPLERSAMNNLAVLYNIEGRREEHAYWERRVARYREDNPYYHAWLGEQAYDTGDWRLAVGYYERALALAPGDSRLLYALGLAHVELGETDLASTYLQRAIKTAILRSDISTYQMELSRVQGGERVGS